MYVTGTEYSTYFIIKFSPSTSAEVNKAWITTSTIPYVLIKQGDNFILT
jgi:hypothetical protein